MLSWTSTRTLSGRIQPELAQDGARLADRTGAVGAGLVPVGRSTQHEARVAGAERADDQVVDRGRALDRTDRDDPAIDAELARRGIGIGEQALLVGRVDPGPGDHARTGGRARRVDQLQRPAHLAGGDDALGHQQVENGVRQRHVVGERRVLDVGLPRVRVIVLVMVVVVAHRDVSGSSQGSKRSTTVVSSAGPS